MLGLRHESLGQCEYEKHIILCLTPPQTLIHDHGYYIIIVPIFALTGYSNEPPVPFVHKKALGDPPRQSPDN